MHKVVDTNQDNTRRRGTILIFVVALLGMLFLMGAAFLSTVTFENDAVDSKKEVREDDAVIDALRAETLKYMDMAWLGLDGQPYNSDVTTSTVVGPDADHPVPTWELDNMVDVCGEVPGLHPLLAPIEPFDTGTSGLPWMWTGSTDLDRLQSGMPWDTMNLAPLTEYPRPNTGVYRLPADAPGGDFDDLGGPPRDADGDGITDCVQRRLDLNLYPLEMRRPMASRLRDPELTELTPVQVAAGYTLDDLFVALRIVQHSALASVSGSHNEILERVIGPGYVNMLRSVYTPSAEERSLRRRGFLPGLNRPPSVLVDEHLKPELLDVLDDPSDSSPARWWPFDLGPSPVVYDATKLAYGEFPSDPSEQYSFWANALDPNNDVNPDVRHLITTISHDDNLLRGWQGLADAAPYDPALLRDGSQGAPLKAIAMYPGDDAGSDREAVDVTTIPDEYRGGSANLAVNYAAGTAVDPSGFDPRHGRLKVSLYSLDPLDLSDEDGPLTSNAVNRPTQREIDTVQGAFTLMLRNVDLNRDGDPADPLDLAWQDDQAAQLTANFFDFVDDSSDGAYDIPTTHEATWIRSPTTLREYRGIERQPFISEVYADITDVDLDGKYLGEAFSAEEMEAHFAVELCYPYPAWPSAATLNLTRYRLAVYDPDGNEIGTWALSGSIACATAAGPGFKVFEGPFRSSKLLGLPAVRLSDPPPPKPSFRILAGYVVELQYDPWDTPPGVGVYVVDRFRAGYDEYTDQFQGDPTALFGEYATPGSATQASLQRDTNGDGWRVCVPFYAKYPNEHRLVSPNFNRYDSHAGANPPNPISAVHAIPSDAGNIADFSKASQAMPTTGCLLLLMRYAHKVEDPTLGAGGLPLPRFERYVPFTEMLHSDPNLVGLVYASAVHQRASLDNGHMPINGAPCFLFDGSADVEIARWPVAGATTAGQALEIPWGQLVFDYFTALPRVNTYKSLEPFDATAKETTLPTVDQDGLRVHGRVSINTAPWKVLSGLPRYNANALPVYSELEALDPATFTYAQIRSDSTPGMSTLGDNLAQTIVAYRERRQVSIGTGDWSGNPAPGFLTVGELILASGGASPPGFRFDAYPTVPPYDYLHAVARLVALSDWVTTRGHVFTIYGNVRGVGTLQYTDRRALRLQETVDRLPSMFKGESPRRIGQRVIGRYADPRSD